MITTVVPPRQICIDKPGIYEGDCLKLIPQLPNDSIDVVVTSPPYWGQRQSLGNGTEDDPRDYVAFLQSVFMAILPKLKLNGIVWINLGDAYNTPVNWGHKDYKYSSLGPDNNGFSPENSAYTKPRFKRRAFIDDGAEWLKYGNLLMLPQRLLIALVDCGYLFRGEVIWSKKNAMPEGRCRRPHRKHESIFLLARHERHSFRSAPPVPSVWTFANETIGGLPHRSRFPVELPRRCIEAYGQSVAQPVVLDPFSGSGSTGIAAAQLGCTYIGFEIDPDQVVESRQRLADADSSRNMRFNELDADAAHQSEIARTGHLDL
jgi:DNA modification methylase